VIHAHRRNSIITAEREQAIKAAFGDPLKDLFQSFNREFGSKK
jgi:hypothetical protein